MSRATLHIAFSQRPVVRLTIEVTAQLVLLAALVAALAVTAAWWRQGFMTAHLSDWFWILLLPVLIVIYFRRCSIFRRDCRVCLPEETRPPDGPRAP